MHPSPLIGGGASQVRLTGGILTVTTSLTPGNIAVPEKSRLPLKGGNEPVTVSLNVVELAVKGIMPVIGKPLEAGELSRL
jgi:hypothetical protein